MKPIRKKVLKKKIRAKKPDAVDDIIAFESGEMSEADMIKMFQRMVDTGQVWKFQGSYGRQAQSLLDAGLIQYPKKKTYDYYGNPIKTRK
ncbi:MAG: hypothetical protein KAJ49_05995 [Arcobacteraceae bacterium]|nr:hypothetical protein [Arcobacteraceae bacterium]